MFPSLTSGLSYVEIFNPQSAESFKHVMLAGSVSRAFDKPSKSYVLVLYNTACLEVPRSSKESLAILHPYLVLQAFIPRGKSFTVELAFVDHSNTKRRIVFTNAREVTRSLLHVRLPCGVVKREVWVNLCFDVLSLVRFCFPSETFKHLDQVRVTAFCKIRRIFSMRLRLRDTTGEQEDVTYYYDMLPPQYEFPRGISSVTQHISSDSVLRTDRPVYFSNSPPKATRKYYPAYKPPRRTIFHEERPSIRVNRSLLPSLSPNRGTLSPTKPRLRHVQLDQHSSVNVRRMTDVSTGEKGVSEARNGGESPGNGAGFPQFFTDSVMKALGVRHFTPPFVNVKNEECEVCRYDPVSRAYAEG